MQFITRAQWGAAAPTWNPGRVNPSRGVFIHYNGPAVSAAVLAGDFESVKRFLQGIQRYHQQTNGWPDIAYSWCVDSAGRCWELRGWDVAQAATLDWNWTSHSVFLPLGGDQAPTPEQIEGVKTVIAEHNKRYGAGFVRGHLEAPNSTSCPGEPTMRLIRAGAFTPGRPAPTPTPAPVAPQPPAAPAGVDPKVNKPVMMRRKTDGTISVFYEGTPFRVDLRPKDVDMFRFFGVPYKGDADAWFWEVTQAVKVG